MTQIWSVICLPQSSFWPLICAALLAVSVLADNTADPTMNDYAPTNKAGSIQAAVNTMYNLEVRKIATKSEPIPTQKVEIESNNIPLLIHFKSQSSKLKVIQSHKGGVGETQKSMSEDEPDILIHEVIISQCADALLQTISQCALPIGEKAHFSASEGNYCTLPKNSTGDKTGAGADGDNRGEGSPDEWTNLPQRGTAK